MTDVIASFLLADGFCGAGAWEFRDASQFRDFDFFEGGVYFHTY